MLIAAGVIAYSSSFAGAFVFADVAHIQTSQRITALWPIWPLLGGRRPVVDVTLAVNYALGEYEAWGYRLLNLVVHFLTVLTLFGIVRRTLLFGPLRARYADSSTWLTTVVGLLWVVHPLNTQAVTYIIQRGESLMSLFYLSTLYFLIRGSTSRHGRMWFAAATIVCGLGMECKAVMMTAPVAVLLYDRSFLSGSFGRALRHRRVGRWDEAGRQFQLALRLLPKHQRAGVRVHLGSILAHSELYGEAITPYEAAFRFDPNHAGAKRGMGELKDVSDPR